MNRGLGISALFAGPSGTGKTMAAEVLANALELDLFRVDLAAVVSKYIGETEKHLRDIFDAVEGAGAVLLFDEADAIASRRSTMVEHGFQRESNAVVSVLLQELEWYNGVVIFATNLAANFDPAFERRIRTHVRFEMPGVEEREKIWRVQIHPKKTPVSADVSFRALAEKYAMSGGDIKNAVIKAAVAAAAEPGAEVGKRIHQRHLERAVEDVLAAKSVMQQSLFDDTPQVAVDAGWRRLAIAAMAIAGTSLVTAIVAIVIALLR
jgi:SpoVK/Ycf46/Vps4 family AAA+-type ATPase